MEKQLKFIAIAEIVIIVFFGAGIYQLFQTYTELLGTHEQLKHQYEAEKKQNISKNNPPQQIEPSGVFPVVVFEAGGLISEGEKTKIKKRLIEPYTLYYNETSDAVISIDIAVPQDEGEPYNVLTIFKDGGYHGFLYGMRGDELEYWMPLCEGENGCEFSEKFRATYPHIVENAEAP